MSDAKAKITLGDDTTAELDVLRDTPDQDVTGVRGLGSEDVFTLDPDFTSTVSCGSKIAFIDDDKEILLHRGFPIDQLVTESNYLEVCYILLYGEKPTQVEYDEFKATATHHTMVREQVTCLFHAFCRGSHPMAVMCGITDALATLCHDSLDVNNPRHREIAAYRLLSRIPTMAAMCYKYSIGQPLVYPRNNLSYTGNSLRMMFAAPCEEYGVSPVPGHAMDHILILHTDHEQNASILAVHTTDSSDANPLAYIAAGTASLWGPVHGGTNEAALRILEEISSTEHVPEFARRTKDKNDSFRLMDFDRRVYKSYNSHAAVMREICHKVLKELSARDDLLQVTVELEHIALNDSHFIERKFYPNVDFYSSIIPRVMSIPFSMSTVIFATACTVNWVTHWNEIHNDGMKIVHPRQPYAGYTEHDC